MSCRSVALYPIHDPTFKTPFSEHLHFMPAPWETRDEVPFPLYILEALLYTGDNHCQSLLLPGYLSSYLLDPLDFEYARSFG
jgi:hypothetical protein